MAQLHIDRAYVSSPVVDATMTTGGKVFAKPWSVRARAPGMFTKLDFKIDLRAKTIACPAGEIELFEPGDTVQFDPEVCKCTNAASEKGRAVSIAEDEARQKSFRRLQQSGAGRQRLRERVHVEHALAHIAARKGPRARYVGTRRNLFDLRRAAVIQNLESPQRLELAA